MFRKLFFVFCWSMSLASYMPGYGHYSGGSSIWGYFTPPLIHSVPSQSHKTAMEAMVDLTNNLAVAILQDHSYSGGNFAFSPYGVASVLVVLYEGARGESARQIHTSVGFPSDKDTIRVGFRDIHRHLRSYFSHEGYLSGISLNKDSSNLKPEYKKILRFYGYDIDASHPSEGNIDIENTFTEGAITKPTKPTVFTSGTISTTTTVTTTTGNQTEKNDTKPTTEETANTTTQLTTTENVLSETNTEEAKQTTTVATTVVPDSSQKTTTIDSLVENTTSQQSENTTFLTTTESQDEKTTTDKDMNKEEELEINLTVEEISTQGNKKDSITTTTENNETNNKEERVPDIRKDVPIASTTEDSHTGKSTTQPAETEENETDFDNRMLIPQIGDMETKRSEKMPTTTTETEPTSTTTTETNIQTVSPHKVQKSVRKGKSLKEEQNNIKTAGNIKISRTNGDVKAVSERIMGILNSRAPLWLEGSTKKLNSRIRRTFTDYLKLPHSADLSLQLQNGMYDTHVSRNEDMYRSLPRLLFLVDGAVDTPVPMMTYTNVFPYAYIPRLHAKALEFPLDDIRYKLLILLPVERRGLRQLIYDLGDFSLDNVLSAMRSARVKAMVPTFMVEGFVILTSSLQKLGIWDVFDPRKANLSGMSLDPELYVRNVEQSVTVVIRNYVEILDIQTRTMAARQMEYEFEATHPFLYFVLDTATNVALMAGQILDPLNSRIY